MGCKTRAERAGRQPPQRKMGNLRQREVWRRQTLSCMRIVPHLRPCHPMPARPSRPGERTCSSRAITCQRLSHVMPGACGLSDASFARDNTRTATNKAHLCQRTPCLSLAAVFGGIRDIHKSNTLRAMISGADRQSSSTARQAAARNRGARGPTPIDNMRITHIPSPKGYRILLPGASAPLLSYSYSSSIVSARLASNTPPSSSPYSPRFQGIDVPQRGAWRPLGHIDEAATTPNADM